MQAIAKHTYGGPEVLQLEETPRPVIAQDQLLVKVKANSANPADWHILRGTPFFARFSSGLFKPKEKVLGADFSGLVEAVGQGVSGFKVGDRVFGENLKSGAFSAYTAVPAHACAHMPEGSDFPEMACVPIAGLTALQALTTHGGLQAGESVLVNGASGGVGHFTVQIAKAYGAQVTAVCSQRNVDFVKGLGADQVIAYDQENIHEHPGSYDLVIDTHGNLTHEDFSRMGQRGVVLGFTTLGHMVKLLLRNAFSSFPLKQFTAEAHTADLTTLAALIQSQKVRVHIEKVYPHDQIPAAIGYIEAMRTRGKVAMVWEADP